MTNITYQEPHLLTTDEILAQMQTWEDIADTMYEELVARVHGRPAISRLDLTHDELLAESTNVQQEWQELQDVIMKRAHERDQLLVVLEKLKAILSPITLFNKQVYNTQDANALPTSASTPPSRKTEPLSSKIVPILTNADFEHVAPEVMQDFLIEKIEWLRARTTDRGIATVDECSASDQLHEQELLNFLLFTERKAKECIAYDA